MAYTPGRAKGSKNKPKSALMRMLQDKYGKDFSPILNMAKIAMDPNADLALQLNANKELAQYLHPKLRSVEVSGDLVTTLIMKDFTSGGVSGD